MTTRAPAARAHHDTHTEIGRYIINATAIAGKSAWLMSWRPPGEEKDFSWLPGGDTDAAGRAFAFALDDTTVSDGNFEGLQDTTDEDNDEWDFEWPEDIADAPETMDTAPELPWTLKYRRLR